MEVQLEAVKQDGYAIKFIENPSLKVQLEAVKQDGDAIELIKNPSLEVQLEAVKQKGCAIKYIKGPSLEVQLEAVKQDGYDIQYIERPLLLMINENDSVSKRYNNIELILSKIYSPEAFKYLMGCNFKFSDKFKASSIYKEYLIDYEV